MKGCITLIALAMALLLTGCGGRGGAPSSGQMGTNGQYEADSNGRVEDGYETPDYNGSGVADDMKDAVDDTANAAEDVTDGVIDGARRVTDDVIDGVDDAVDSAREGLDRAAQSGRGAVNGAG